MSKTSGLGAAIAVGDHSGSAQTITNDVTNFTMSTPYAVQDITGVDKSAHERLLLLADGSVSLSGVFNPAANMSHAVFSVMGVNRTTKITPTSNSTPYLSMVCLFTDYSLSRSATGELPWTAPGQLADGTVPSWTNS
jgi:hypothetical protein